MQFFLENMFTIKTISLASQIRTHRPSDCYFYERFSHFTTNRSQYSWFDNKISELKLINTHYSKCYILKL